MEDRAKLAGRARRVASIVEDEFPIRHLLEEASALADRLDAARSRTKGGEVLLLARCAAVMRELVAYGSDRDAAIAELVRKCATLQMKVEDMERGQ